MSTRTDSGQAQAARYVVNGIVAIAVHYAVLSFWGNKTLVFR